MGSQMNTSGIRTFTAGATLGQYIRVKMSGANVVAADAGEKGIGITEKGASSGDPIPVRLWACDGTRKVTLGEALSAGDAVYGAASGKFKNDVSGNILGYLLEDGSGDGSIVEMACAD